MGWARRHGGYPTITMGASAGGYAAADVATGTEATVLKGWTAWGTEEIPTRYPLAPDVAAAWPRSRFRRHLHASIRYVMEDAEVDGVFDPASDRTLLVFTTRVRRRDGRRPGRADLVKLFAMATTRKLPAALKYVPRAYELEPVVFATRLPDRLRTEYVRPLTRKNYHAVIEASCLVPYAMGPAVVPTWLSAGDTYPNDAEAVFIDGGFTLKMPMAVFDDDPRFRNVAEWSAADHTVIFCCDPRGRLWETSMRLRALDDEPDVAQARTDGRLLVIYPDHEVEASFLCFEPEVIMRTFERGREQGRRLLETDQARRFFEGPVI